MQAEKKKVAFHTLGCKLNFAETSYIARSLPEDRFTRVKPDEQADIYIINTCSVTDAADRKCRQAIKKFTHQSPGAYIAVVGCYAQLRPDEVSSIPGVDLVLGSNEKFDLSAWLTDIQDREKAVVHSAGLTTDDPFRPSWSSGDRTRSFLKVQDGCDYGCSYCTIPLARGKSRNPLIKDIKEEAIKITETGIREIVLTGVNIGDFGKSTGESFNDLVRELVTVEGIERIRLSSVEPNLITSELIELSSTYPSILPHFHIPLQSGSDKILGLMRRRYRRDVFAERINMIRQKLPLAGIGADVIVGFPGETREDFNDTYNFLEGLPVSYLHVFSYSERPGTIAEKLPLKVSSTEKELRSKMLIQLSESKNRLFMELCIGSEERVLFERARKGSKISGFTGNYLKVEHDWDNKLPGRIARVRITGINNSGNLDAEIIEVL
ncbi:MAG: tRNA (N(6)-L-threonylcarbamoyladenosine(37)-C(2))-methylthiotransferase MtaB [Bacteroidales bacterium]